MSDLEMINNFIETKKTDEERLTLDFAKQILDYDIQKKRIGEDIKDIKKEAKANGISVAQVIKVVKVLKQETKIDSLEKKEFEFL